MIDRPLTAKPASHQSMIVETKFQIGDVVRHRKYDFRGVIFDIDPEFNNTEEWYEAIPEDVRPVKEQPFYHLLAENAETQYVAYVSEQNLVRDLSGEPVGHPQVTDMFDLTENGYVFRSGATH